MKKGKKPAVLNIRRASITLGSHRRPRLRCKMDYTTCIFCCIIILVKISRRG
jgi:hypothetical protein